MSSLFGNEAVRLLREDWPNALMLAQELFAILTSPQPITTPLSLAQPANGTPQPAIKVGGIQNGDTLFQLNGKNGEPYGNISIVDGALVFSLAATGTPLQIDGSSTVPIQPRAPDQPPGKPQQQQQQSTAGNAFPGFITGGTGDTYTVSIYPQGISGPSQTVTVKQLNILATEIIPAGEAVIVLLGTDGMYTMQFPVWGKAS